jgi:hypothetical protein
VPVKKRQAQDHVSDLKDRVGAAYLWPHKLEVIVAAGLTTGQNLDSPTTSSARLLALPQPAVPISFEQIEEHSTRFADGTSRIDFTVTGKSYRDSAGRLRLESETQNARDHSSASSTTIIDPVIGFRCVFSKDVAYRMNIPASNEMHFFFAEAADGQESPHKWKVAHTETEEKMIEGYIFKGSRIETSAEDVADLTTTIDQWYSDELKLMGSVNRSGPYKAYTIRIQSLSRQDPDPELFRIPSDYKIVDVQLS